MLKYSSWSALVLIGVLALPGRSAAEHIRFRFETDATGSTRQIPIGPEGAIGEKTTGVGLIPKPYREPFKATHLVTYRHPFTGRNVTVPILFPPGALQKPDIRSDRIFYHYGIYQIEVRFLPNGAVDAIYNGAFLYLTKH